MRTFPTVRLDVFADHEQREEIKKITDHLRQVSGALSRSVQTGQTPAANPVPDPNNPTTPAPPSGNPAAAHGDLLVGLANGTWAKLPAGANDSVLVVAAGTPTWLGILSQLGMTVEWRANGPYLVDTNVDGGVLVHTAMTLQEARLYRLTPGTADSTSVVLKQNGSTVTTLTIAFDDADKRVSTILAQPVAAGDVLTIDITAKEAGSPADFVFTVKGTI